jgi:hypothetical protein
MVNIIAADKPAIDKQELLATGLPCKFWLANISFYASEACLLLTRRKLFLVTFSEQTNNAGSVFQA